MSLSDFIKKKSDKESLTIRRQDLSESKIYDELDASIMHGINGIIWSQEPWFRGVSKELFGTCDQATFL